MLEEEVTVALGVEPPWVTELTALLIVLLLVTPSVLIAVLVPPLPTSVEVGSIAELVLVPLSVFTEEAVSLL